MWRLTRPLNLSITALSVAVGACSLSPRWSQDITLACISAALIAAGGNAVNDIYDLAIDKINRPNRPLPSGMLTTRTALFLAITLFSAGIFLGALIDLTAAAIAVCAAGALVWYSASLKRKPFLGNITVACVSALAFIYGGYAGDSVKMSCVPAVFALLMHLGRELIKDAQDVEGDAALNARTLAVVKGPAFASRLSAIAFVLLALLLPLPYVLGWFGDFFLYIALAGVLPVLAWSAWVSWHSSDSKTMRRVSSVIKLGMLLGLAAIWFDRWP